MRKFLVILITVLFVCACSDDEPQIIEPINPINSEVINVTGLLQGVNNWTSNNVYVLASASQELHKLALNKLNIS